MQRFLLLVLFAVPLSLLGQSDRGTITGTITDPTNRVIPNAQVLVMNEATGIKSATVTTEAGAYTIPLLMIGSYKLEARASGFKTYDRPGVSVQVGQTTRI